MIEVNASRFADGFDTVAIEVEDEGADGRFGNLELNLKIADEIAELVVVAAEVGEILFTI